MCIFKRYCCRIELINTKSFIAFFSMGIESVEIASHANQESLLIFRVYRFREERTISRGKKSWGCKFLVKMASIRSCTFYFEYDVYVSSYLINILVLVDCLICKRYV